MDEIEKSNPAKDQAQRQESIGQRVRRHVSKVGLVGGAIAGVVLAAKATDGSDLVCSSEALTLIRNCTGSTILLDSGLGAFVGYATGTAARFGANLVNKSADLLKSRRSGATSIDTSKLSERRLRIYGQLCSKGWFQATDPQLQSE